MNLLDGNLRDGEVVASHDETAIVDKVVDSILREDELDGCRINVVGNVKLVFPIRIYSVYKSPQSLP